MLRYIDINSLYRSMTISTMKLFKTGACYRFQVRG